MQQLQAYILMGTSGSGKSTVRRLLAKLIGSNRTEFSMDDCRAAMFLESGEPIPKGPRPLYEAAFKYCAENREEFDSYVTKTWEYCLRKPVDIICDNTHLNQGYREKWITELRARGYFINLIYVKAPLEVVLERQKYRDKEIPLEVLEAQYAKLEEPLEHEFDRLIVVDGTKEQTEEKWQLFLSRN